MKEFWSALVGTLVGTLGGGLVTWLVSRHYYRKSAQDVRWEARAGSIPYETLRLLVAYYKWGKELEEGQGIDVMTDTNGIGPANIRAFEQVCTTLHHAQLASRLTHAFAVPKGSSGHPRPSFQSFVLNDEGKALAQYLSTHRSYEKRVVRWWKMKDDPELLWSEDEGEQPGKTLSELGERKRASAANEAASGPIAAILD